MDIEEKVAEITYYFENRGKYTVKWEILAANYKTPFWVFANQLLEELRKDGWIKIGTESSKLVQGDD